MKTIITLAATAMFFAAANLANATTVSLTTIDDGSIRTWAGPVVDTTSTGVAVTQSGGLIRNGIFEFDLSSIADNAVINSVVFQWINTRFVSNTGGNPAAVDLFTFLGDGVVTLADYSAAGTQVVDSSTPAGGSGGDVDSFAFSDLSDVTAALLGDLLTIRFETDSFASISVASLENTTHGAAQLIIDYTAAPAPVPLPASLPLAMIGLMALAGLGCNRRKSAT